MSQWKHKKVEQLHHKNVFGHVGQFNKLWVKIYNYYHIFK